jgi:tripartite-type tricarboxylate transporter receptor subunit TctC
MICLSRAANGKVDSGIKDYFLQYCDERGTMLPIRTLAHVGLLLAFWSVPALQAVAQPYPSRPIKIIVPYPPGGNADLVARLYAEKLGGLLGTTTVIDNRPGGGGAIGAEAAARAAPDGYTLTHATNSELGVIPAVRSDLPYDPVKDLIAISTTSRFPFMLVTRKGLPVKTLQDLVALAKQPSSKITFATIGTGTANHLIIEPLKARFGIDVQIVPYRGAGPTLTDLLGGHVDANFATVSSMLPQVKAGDLTALLVTSNERYPLLPDVPSAGELGLNDLVTENWTGFLAPAGTDRAIVMKWHDAIVKAGADPALVEAVRKAGSIASTSASPEEVQAIMKADIEHWRRVIKDFGIKVE